LFGCTAEAGEELAASVDTGFPEHGLEVILDGVRRDEETLADRARVETGEQGVDDVSFSGRQRIGATQQIEGSPR
jgi:hypothetical protein